MKACTGRGYSDGVNVLARDTTTTAHYSFVCLSTVLLLAYCVNVIAQEGSGIEAMEELIVSRDLFANGPFEFRRIDGTGNNLHQILRTRGAVGTRYRRVTPVEYEDGIQAPAGLKPKEGPRMRYRYFHLPSERRKYQLESRHGHAHR